MPSWLLSVHIDRAPFLVVLYGIAAAFVLVLIVRRPTRRWVRASLIGILAGGIIGFLAVWLTSDVFDTFGLPLTDVTKMWVTLGGAGIGLAVVSLWRSPVWRKVVAVVGVAVFAITVAAGINVDFGAYPNLRDVLFTNPYPAATAQQLDQHAEPLQADLAAVWQAPAKMPAKGQVRSVDIPATTSHFPARNGQIYLPPAALTKNPPALPVIEMMSGQPGFPAEMFTLAHTEVVLDAYAAKHHGLAPIVVVPDQLGNAGQNPMCVNSPLGNSATYLTVDVPRWINSHLHVATGASEWAVAGFSQGATCAMQFGAADPTLFGSILSISGELEPTIGADTVAKAFHGSVAAYDQAKPLTLLKENAPYSNSFAIFGVGSKDARYTAFQRTTMAAANAAGMKTQWISAPGSAHDWNTVRYVMKTALPTLADRMGL